MVSCLRCGTSSPGRPTARRRTADSTVTTYTYDLAGNRLTATTGAMTITAAYDRLGRVLTVDDEDAGTTPDTTYTYSLTSPTWSDPSGSTPPPSTPSTARSI